MNNLILGASGIVGTGISKYLNNTIELSHSDLEMEDIKSIRRYIYEYKPEIIYNCIGLSSPRICEDKPDEAFKINTIAVHNLAKICNKEGITLVHISTDAVFKGNQGYCVESTIPNPVNIYGISKYAAELSIRNICDEYYIIRIPIQFGPRRNNRIGILDKFIINLKEDKPIHVSSDRYMSPSYNIDIGKRLVDIIKMEWGIYHINNKGCATLYDVVLELAKLMESSSEIYKCSEDIFEPEFKPKSTPMKSNKIKELRGWKEALGDYINDII